MKVFGKVDRALVEVPQSFARNSLCVDHVMVRKLDVEELQLIMFACSIKGNRRPIDQAACCHQDAVNEQGVLLRKVQIGVWRIRAKGRARDPNRQHVFDPCLTRVALPKRIAPDPLNGAYPAENGWQQIAHSEVFDFPIAIRGPDCRALQKA